MSIDKEFDLLIDIATLLKKYDIATFQKLASIISEPNFINYLSTILAKSAESADIISPLSRRKKATGHVDFRTTLIQMEKRDAEKSAILINLFDGLKTKLYLPSLRDIKSFAADNGLRPIKATSREQAIIPFTKMFLNLPSKKIKELAFKIHLVEVSKESSLESWSDIIFRTDEEQKP